MLVPLPGVFIGTGIVAEQMRVWKSCEEKHGDVCRGNLPRQWKSLKFYVNSKRTQIAVQRQEDDRDQLLLNSGVRMTMPPLVLGRR